MKKKTPLIFIHGLRGDHYGLLEVADALRMDYEIITPDLPGYGEREALEAQTLDCYSEWLHEFVGSLKLKQKPVIIGHSMGSIIVSHYLVKYPDDTDDRAVFLSPIVRSKIGQKRSNVMAKIIHVGLGLLSGHARYRFMKSKFLAFLISRYLTYDRLRQSYIDRQHFEHSGNFTSTKSVINDIDLSMREQTTLKAEKQILLCMGDHDRLTKVKNVRKRMRNKKNLTLEVLKGTGHLLNYEYPKLTASTIRNFLESH